MSKFYALPLYVSAALIWALPVSAADNHTYRNGQSYASIGVANAQMCEMSCSGDAQCRGWNFLRSGARDGSGVCEFNATHANPSAHPFAISGTNSGNVYSSGQVVPGDTRTFRVGNPQDSIVPAPATLPQRRPVERPVIRKRVFPPQQARPSQQSRQSVMPARAPMPPRAQNPAQQQTRMHPQKPQTVPANHRRPIAPYAADPRFAPRQPAPSQMRAPAAPHSAARQPMMPARLPTAMPQRMQQPMAQPHRPQAHVPQSHAPQSHAPQSHAPQPQAAQRSAQPTAMMHQPQAAPSLYGSLYDVPSVAPQSSSAHSPMSQRPALAPVTPPQAAPSPTPPLYSERGQDDPNAPVTTSAAVPSLPVTRAPLGLAEPSPQTRPARGYPQR